MPIYSGYDTDDLTQRQYHYFCKIRDKGLKTQAIIFMKYCIMKNMGLNLFENYPDDCEWLLTHNKVCIEAGINLEEIYV